MTPAAWRTFTPGNRVVVRRRLLDDEAGRWSDVIGLVVSVGDDGLLLVTDTVRQTAPIEVFIAAGEIETAKVIPPKPEVRRPL